MERIFQTLRVMVEQYDLLDLSVEDQAASLIVGSAKGEVDDPGDRA